MSRRDKHGRSGRAGSVVGLVALLATVAFLWMGFQYDMWHPGWMVFLAVPITGMIVDITTKSSPIAIVTSVISILSIVVFLYIGFTTNIWHPTWMVFFAVPISGAIMRIIVGDKYDKQGKHEDEQTEKKEL